jgi:hypothetical protein
VFAEGRLVAVLVRLSDQHDSLAGQWFFEAGFGRLDGPQHPTFDDIEAAQDWIADRLTYATTWTALEQPGADIDGEGQHGRVEQEAQNRVGKHDPAQGT